MIEKNQKIAYFIVSQAPKIVQREGLAEKLRAFPTEGLQTRNALEMSSVVRDQHQSVGQGCRGNQDVCPREG